MTDKPRQRSLLKEAESVTTFLSQTISYSKKYDYREMNDVVVENFHSRSKSGEVIINPLTFVATKENIPDDIASFTHYVTGKEPYTTDVPDSASSNLMRTIMGYYPQSAPSNFPGLPVSVDQEHELELRKQLVLAFIDKPQFGFGEDIAEIGETIRLLRNPLAGLTKLLIAFEKKVIKKVSRKGTVLTAARRAEAIAGIWASYSFAFAPLVRSIDDIIAALYEKSELELRRTSRSKGSLSDESSEEVSGHFSGSAYWQIPKMNAKAIISNTLQVSYHVGLTYEAPQADTLRNKLGLEWKDLIVTGYEVVPMSFMLDRIVSIKNVLSGLLNLVDPNVKMLGGFVTKRTSEIHSVFLTDWSVWEADGDYLQGAAAFQPHTSETFTMERVPWKPDFTNALPIWNPKELINSASKIADLTSLLTLQIGPLIRRLYVYS